MKKLLALCLSLCLLFALGTILCAADAAESSDPAELTVKYGKADLALALMDAFDEEKQLPGFMNWGNGFMQDGRIYMECAGGNLYDIYNLTTVPLMENTTLSDNTYLVFAAENTSDGDIFFGFQPDVYYNDAAIHAYLSSELAKENPIKLVYKDGTVEDAEFWMQRSAGREVFAVPYEFDGYIIIPHAVLATDIESTTPVTTDGKVEYAGFGLHALPDDASYMEFTITAAYACSTLPAYEAPEEQPVETADQETQAPETNEPETNAPETNAPETNGSETNTPETSGSETNTPETNAPDSGAADESTESESAAPETGAVNDTLTSDDEGGCASSIAVMGAVAILALSAGVILKKRD